MLSCRKSTFCLKLLLLLLLLKNVLHKRHEQMGFHFRILFLKHVKELEFVIFCGIKAKFWSK